MNSSIVYIGETPTLDYMDKHDDISMLTYDDVKWDELNSNDKLQVTIIDLSPFTSPERILREVKLSTRGAYIVALMPWINSNEMAMSICKGRFVEEDMSYNANAMALRRTDAFNAGADYVLQIQSDGHVYELSTVVSKITKTGRHVQSFMEHRGDFCIDRETYKVFFREQDLQLSRTKYKLMDVFMRSAKDEILNDSHIVNQTGIKTKGSLKAHLSQLRRLIEQSGGDGRVLQPQYNKGYVFNPAVK